MRCNAYCTAAFYDINKLSEKLATQGLKPQFFDDILHVQQILDNHSTIIDVFYFPFGALVIWGADEIREQAIVSDMLGLEIEPVSKKANDLIYYRYENSSKKSFIDEDKNEIVLHNDLIFTKISISHALAQSVKLQILEASVANLLSQTAPIQKELAKYGKVSLSKKAIAKQMGVLFSEKYSINMHSDILDVPEFFWRRPSYEPLYLMTVEFHDITQRQNLMNQRLEMIHDLYSILSDELNARHSSRLEIIIIILITIEVIIALIDKNLIEKLSSFIL